MTLSKFWYMVLGIFIYFTIDHIKLNYTPTNNSEMDKGEENTTTLETPLWNSLKTENISDSKRKPELEDVADVVGLDGVNYCQDFKDTDLLVVIPSGK